MALKRGRGRWGLNGLAGALKRGRGRPSNVAGGRAVGGVGGGGGGGGGGGHAQPQKHLKEGSQWPRNLAGGGGAP